MKHKKERAHKRHGGAKETPRVDTLGERGSARDQSDESGDLEDGGSERERSVSSDGGEDGDVDESRSELFDSDTEKKAKYLLFVGKNRGGVFFLIFMEHRLVGGVQNGIALVLLL